MLFSCTPKSAGIFFYDTALCAILLYFLGVDCILYSQYCVSVARTVELVSGSEEATVCSILEELAFRVHELVGVRMHRIAVCEWEVKLWLDSVGLASGAWRVVVTNVTGHTCTVHVSNLPLDISCWHLAVLGC